MLAVVPTLRPAPRHRADFCLLLDDVQDPGNVGSMLRSAAAAGVRAGVAVEALRVRVVAQGAARGAGCAFLPRYPRGRRPAAVGRRAIERPVARSLRPVAAGGISVYDARLGGRVAIAIGNEGAGLDPALAAQATQRVTIPMPGGMESLNAAAAAAVCLFECVRQRQAPPR